MRPIGSKNKIPKQVYMSFRLPQKMADYLNLFPSRSQKLRDIIEEHMEKVSKNS
jgi:predicted DNA-binding protein